MYSELATFEELKVRVLSDIEATGMDVSTRNRYPIRFVLFDNFQDCGRFVYFVQEDVGAIVQSVDKWIDGDYPDLMVTYTELANKITEHIKKINGSNCVIAPFSELARFYDNECVKTFDSLLKTIKAIEANAKAAEMHQRVYIPIVGLEGKMETFNNDTQSVIWRLRSENKCLTYRLILTDGETFGVKGLEKYYTVVNNVHEWLNIWKDSDKQVTPDIICTSRSIFANHCFAQPDNAFSFVTCKDPFEFLTKGLQLQFGGLEKDINDGDNWNKLASQVNLEKGFSFSKYVRNHFLVSDIDGYQSFIKLWLDNHGLYERWLLARYYKQKEDAEAFIIRNLAAISSLTGNDFIEHIVLDMTEIESEVKVRQYCLIEAAKHAVILREGVEATFNRRLIAIAEKYNASSALRYCSGLTAKEKELAISWLGKGLVSIEQLKSLYPDLYHYCVSPIGVSVNVPSWLASYMKEYKNAKISNVYSKGIENIIKDLNGSETSFDKWYQEFSTTRTLLNGRNDIEVFYWIDGLGVEWIPLVKEIVREKNSHGIYLNEIKIARSVLPSKTDINKADMLKLLPEGENMLKVGDLDNLAHQPTNMWPSTIIKEINLVREIIEDVILKYNGKKVAIVSDHGLTYLSQLCDGLGLNGVESDHHGRIAIKKNGSWTSDNNYFRLEDGKTVCALRHNSLCSKVPKGQGIHGGCTPEEVLVPIFIISNYINATEWTADLLTIELSGSNPTLRFRIKNIPSVETPMVEYNGVRYAIYQIDNDIFETDAIPVDEHCNNVSLIIGGAKRDYQIKTITGAKEDDLFGGF